MAGSGLPAIRNGYQQPSGAHANGRGLPNDDIRHRISVLHVDDFRSRRPGNQGGGEDPQKNWFTYWMLGEPN